MRKHFKKVNVFLIVLLVLNLVISGVVLTMEINERLDEKSNQEQYILYIGTNDKDTNLQEIPLEECRIIIEEICLKYITGFTIMQANGIWTDDSENTVKEDTLLCFMNGATEEQVHAISDQLLIELNQASIMVEKNDVRYEFRNQ